MNKNIKNHIYNLKINERKFFAISTALVLAGGGVLTSTQTDSIVGIAMLTFGFYSGFISQEYHQMAKDMLSCEEKKQKIKKLGM